MSLRRLFCRGNIINLLNDKVMLKKNEGIIIVSKNNLKLILFEENPVIEIGSVYNVKIFE